MQYTKENLNYKQLLIAVIENFNEEQLKKLYYIAIGMKKE
ncbi:hypothetical protein C8E03_11095 [Lachnotalea glycerini]|uniref:Uncharacterized protein n=1 Tax=Lachnotalea glycerini TaxID=1763509 RepID=A0A318ETJ8_9FIRM|nr:hypothetical protein C8E03_11095 [Lachnotalea glycerini]